MAWKGIARLKLGEGISGRAITEQRSIYIPDTKAESGFIYFDPQIRSLLVVPLIVRGEVIGTLSIDDSEPNAFDQELRLLTIAAAQAAVAIENAQLYESLRSSYDELEHFVKFSYHRPGPMPVHRSASAIRGSHRGAAARRSGRKDWNPRRGMNYRRHRRFAA